MEPYDKAPSSLRLWPIQSRGYWPPATAYHFAAAGTSGVASAASANLARGRPLFGLWVPQLWLGLCAPPVQSRPLWRELFTTWRETFAQSRLTSCGNSASPSTLSAEPFARGQSQSLEARRIKGEKDLEGQGFPPRPPKIRSS